MERSMGKKICQGANPALALKTLSMVLIQDNDELEDKRRQMKKQPDSEYADVKSRLRLSFVAFLNHNSIVTALRFVNSPFHDLLLPLTSSPRGFHYSRQL